MNNIRVVLIEDHELTRTVLRTTLQQHPEIDWVAEAKNGKEGVRLLNNLRPDVVIIDIGLPDLDGISLISELKSRLPSIKILILTLNNNEDEVLRAFASGADAYCIKTSRVELLIEAIKVTREGNAWIDPAIAKIVLSKTHSNAYMNPRDNPFDITDRELQVLQLIVDGDSNAEIAEKLHITIGTVKTHVRNILNKLSAADRTQAAVCALRSGLVR